MNAYIGDNAPKLRDKGGKREKVTIALYPSVNREWLNKARNHTQKILMAEATDT